MTKRKVKYNSAFLPFFIEKITTKGMGTKANIVSAMNEGREDGRVTTVKQLGRWADTGKPLKLECMINLVNHFEDVQLSDFFIYEDTFESVDITPQVQKGVLRKSNKRTMKETNSDTDNIAATIAVLKNELQQARSAYEQDINALHASYREREDQIRKNYDQTIKELILRIPLTLDKG